MESISLNTINKHRLKLKSNEFDFDEFYSEVLIHCDFAFYPDWLIQEQLEYDCIRMSRFYEDFLDKNNNSFILLLDDVRPEHFDEVHEHIINEFNLPHFCDHYGDFVRSNNWSHLDCHYEIYSMGVGFGLSDNDIYEYSLDVLEWTNEEFIASKNLDAINQNKGTKKIIYPRGFVYLIGNKSESYYKIGISKSPEKRIKSLQTSTPFDLDVINKYQIQDYKKVEKELHTKYRSENTKREWFRLSDYQVIEINKFLKEKEIIEV